MQYIALFLAALSTVFATNPLPIVTSFSEAGCAGAPLATWTGVPEDAFCEATPGALALSIVPGTHRCTIDVSSTSDCDGPDSNFTQSVPVTESCFTAEQEFGSVRILCITTG
ncbi:hypothetical protein B0H15DRAFT_803380 [Mycena belliarum]|uniref:Uncharacterized protein n=1 Tax=Mycena belliarum TaxID=1033014 RepID=A0AAD6TYG1_9AGAR|nr:hypothetical protein B0H15DRAFT_803380 [Mycena belliae]